MRPKQDRQIAEAIQSIDASISTLRVCLLQLSIDIFLLLALQSHQLRRQSLTYQFDALIQALSAHPILVVEHVLIGEDRQRLSNSHTHFLIQVLNLGFQLQDRESVAGDDFNCANSKDIHTRRGKLNDGTRTDCSCPIMKA